MRTSKSFSILFWIYSSRTTGDLKPIYVRITVNGKRANFSLKVKVKQQLWDPKKAGKSMEKQNRNPLMKRILLSIIGLLFVNMVSTQDLPELSNQLRINFLNPGIDYETVITKSTVLSLGGGVGYFGNLDELSGPTTDNGFQYVIAPFFDMQYKYIYNRKRRLEKGKSLLHNSGNYISLRGFWKGETIAENVNRLDSNDFMFGVTWGFQRSYDKIHFLFDVGPVYYFDTMDNNGFFPVMVQLNIGLNLHKE